MDFNWIKLLLENDFLFRLIVMGIYFLLDKIVWVVK